MVIVVAFLQLIKLLINALVLVNMKAINVNIVIEKTKGIKCFLIKMYLKKLLKVKGCNSNPCASGTVCLSTGQGNFICKCK